MAAAALRCRMRSVQEEGLGFGDTRWQPIRQRTLDMNFLQTGRMSWLRVALNIMTCFSWGVFLKMSCTSPRMSAGTDAGQGGRQDTL